MDFKANQAVMDEMVKKVGEIHVGMTVILDLLKKGEIDAINAANGLDNYGRELRDYSITIGDMTYWMKKTAKAEGVAL